MTKKIIIRTEILFGDEMGCKERSNPIITTFEHSEADADQYYLKCLLDEHRKALTYSQVKKSKVLYWRDM